MSFEIMLAVLWLGMYAAGATILLRVMPFIAPYVERGVKPWACDKCMSFWLILFGVTGLPTLAKDILHYKHIMPAEFLLAGPAAYALSLYMLRVLTEPLGPPPSFGPNGSVPELIDMPSDVPPPPPFSEPPSH